MCGPNGIANTSRQTFLDSWSDLKVRFKSIASRLYVFRLLGCFVLICSIYWFFVSCSFCLTMQTFFSIPRKSWKRFGADCWPRKPVYATRVIMVNHCRAFCVWFTRMPGRMTIWRPLPIPGVVGVMAFGPPRRKRTIPLVLLN